MISCPLSMLSPWKLSIAAPACCHCPTSPWPGMLPRVSIWKVRRNGQTSPGHRRVYHLHPKDGCCPCSIHFNITHSTPLLLASDSLRQPLLTKDGFLEEVLPDFSITPTWLQLSPLFPTFPAVPVQLSSQVNMSHSMPPHHPWELTCSSA